MIAARVVAWQLAQGRHGLPWQGTRDPYRVWVSEVMLQQTRVAAVLPYYRRFLRRFPTVRSLARARVEDVLRLWAGLGYYSRARHLHRCAAVVVEREDVAHAGLERELADPAEVAARADDHARLGIAVVTAAATMVMSATEAVVVSAAMVIVTGTCEFLAQ